MANKSISFQLTVEEVPPEPDYFPSIDPASATVPKGAVASYNCSFLAVAGFTGPVMLAVSGLPAGAVATFDINPIGVDQVAVLSIATADVMVGTYGLSLDASA